MSNNTASGNDRVQLQVSKVGGGKKPKPSTSSAKGATFRNVRTGNARVGRQIDVVHGDVNL